MPVMLISVIFIAVSCIPQLFFGFSNVSAILTIGLLVIYIKWSAILSRPAISSLLLMSIPFMSALVAYQGNVWVATIYVMQLCAISLVFAIGFSGRSGFTSIMIFATLLRLAYQITGTLLAPELFGLNPLNVDSVIAEFNNLYGGAVGSVVPEFEKVFLIMYPCLLIISQVVFSYIALSFAAYMQKGVYAPSFCLFRVEREFSIALLSILISTILLRGLSVVTVNVLIILLFFYGVSGLSLIDYQLRKRSIRGFVRILLYALVLIVELCVSLFFKTSYFLTIIAILGLSDSFVNFREVNMGGN